MPLIDILTKYIDRQITIMGEDAKPLIIQACEMHLNSVLNVNDGQVERLEGAL